jgi:hypothetical protein
VVAFISNYFGGDDPNFNILESLVESLVPSAANSYQNNNLYSESFFSENQVFLIDSIMNAIRNNSVEGIDSVLDDAQEEVSKSGMSAQEQAPLFMAISYAKAANSYWTEILSQPPASTNWSNYLNGNNAINYANLPFWTLATFESALNGYAQVQQLAGATTNIVSTAGRTIGIAAALTASIGVTSAKVLLKMVQRPRLEKNKFVITNLGDDELGKPKATWASSRAGNVCVCFTFGLGRCQSRNPMPGDNCIGGA